jgi:hypothetical protein
VVLPKTVAILTSSTKSMICLALSEVYEDADKMDKLIERQATR